MQLNLDKKWEKNVTYNVEFMLCGVMYISSYNFIFCL